jgi:SAM-dependent methyltransferase
MPLSVVGLPTSSEEAQRMARLVMDLRRCAMCGHVFHTEFDYANVPYRSGSNLVFNAAASWKKYQRELATAWIDELSLAGKRILEIGCGDGTFLEPFLERGSRCFAFEPGPDAPIARARGIEVLDEHFTASRLPEIRPDAIVCRHVIEHLADPLEFMQAIALYSDAAGVRPLFLGEVPQVDKAIAEVRINDFLYEHVSNFTKRSFQTLMERSGFEVLAIESRYDDEVVTVVARPTDCAERGRILASAERFREALDGQVTTVRGTIERWVASNRRVALWGATGKGAATINMFNLGRELCPIVVDSDPRKIGAFVPGTGQPIASPAILKTQPVDDVVVCTQWRARDIEREAREVWGIGAEMHVVHRGALVPLTPELAL